MLQPVPSSNSPPKTVGAKRKRKDDLPTGIYKAYKQFQIKTRDLVTSKITWLLFKTIKEAVAAKDAERTKQAEHKRQRTARAQAEKLGGLPTGIQARYNKFRIDTRDVVTSKTTSLFFKTIEEAVAARDAECAKWEAHKRQKAARPQAEIRAKHLATNGNNLKLERAFATALHAADPKVETMNDAVLTDSCGFFYDNDPTLALGIQLKTTAGPMASQLNTWQFKYVNRYPRMPVVCWRVDTQDGWIYDGTDIVKFKSGCLNITPGGVNAKLAINTDDERTRATPLPIDGIVARLRELAADRERFPPRTKAYWSWQFGGKKAHAQLKERIELYLEELRDPGATFPEAQNGAYDQLGGDGVTRRQLKTACVMAGHEGRMVNLKKSAGKVDGTLMNQPYAAGAFDELVVYSLDWQTNTARVWRIPESKLVEKGHICTSTQKGKKSIYVYEFSKPQSKYRHDTNTWTAVFFEGTVPIDLPTEAEAAAGHLLDDLRSGRVK